MAFQSVNNTAEIDVIYTLQGEPVQNVFYARFGGEYALANLQSLADAVGTNVGNNWLPLQAAEAVFIRTEVRGLEFPNDLIATSLNGAGPGEDVTEALPNNVSIAIKKESGFTGRSARGRTYWIGIPADKTSAPDENHITDAYRDDIVDALEALRAVIGGVFNWDPVLVSRFAEGVQRDEGVTFGWVSSIMVDKRVDSQRNRLPSS